MKYLEGKENSKGLKLCSDCIIIIMFSVPWFIALN